MKKLLSVILAMLMLFSAFSCVSAFAVDEETLPETEITTEGDVTEPSTDEPTTDDEPEFFIDPPSEVVVENTVDGISLKWDCVDGAERYKVYRRAAGEIDYAVIEEISADSFVENSQYVDTDVVSGGYYKYAVASVLANVQSGFKESDLARYMAVPAFTVDNHAEGIVVSWKTVPGAASYKIYRRDAGQENAVLIGRAAGSLTSYIDRTVKSGFYYEYFMVVSSDYRTDKYTSEKTQGLVIKCVGTASVVLLENVSDGIKVIWRKVAGATGYMIYRRAAGEQEFTYLLTTGNTDSYIDENVVPGQFYTYKARAVSNKYIGWCNDLHKVLRRMEAPEMAAAANGNDGIYVRWNLVEGATEYQIWRRSAGAQKFVYIGKTKEYRFKDTSAVFGKYYAYKVRAVYNSSYSDYSPTPIVWKFTPLNGKITGTVAYNWYQDAVRTAKANPKLSFNFKNWAECVWAKGIYGDKAVVNAVINNFKSNLVSEKEAVVYTFKNGYGNEIIPPCDLAYSNVKSATTVKKGNNYIVTIVFYDLNKNNKDKDIRKVTSAYLDLAPYMEGLCSAYSVRECAYGTGYKNFTIVAELTPDGKIVRLDQKGLADCMFACYNGDLGRFRIETDVNTYVQYSNFKY